MVSLLFKFFTNFLGGETPCCRFGFGVLDASRMARAAMDWENVGEDEEIAVEGR